MRLHQFNTQTFDCQMRLKKRLKMSCESVMSSVLTDQLDNLCFGVSQVQRCNSCLPYNYELWRDFKKTPKTLNLSLTFRVYSQLPSIMPKHNRPLSIPQVCTLRSKYTSVCFTVLAHLFHFLAALSRTHRAPEKHSGCAWWVRAILCFNWRISEGTVLSHAS